MAYGQNNYQGNPVTNLGTESAYDAQVRQFKDLESGINASQKAAMQALRSQQGVNAALPGQLANARSAGMTAIRANNANAIGAAGSRAAMQGAGGYGALLQAGKQGGIDSAQFGANATIDAAKAMLNANQQLNQLSSSALSTFQGGYDALQDAGGSLGAIRNEQLGEAEAEMARIFDDLDGVWNTDADEANYETRMRQVIRNATDPYIKQKLMALKFQYDRQFYGTGEFTNGGVKTSI